MHILVIGGTRFFGVHTVKQLLANGHNVTIATRGSHGNPFGTQVSHILMDRTNEDSVKTALSNREFDPAPYNGFLTDVSYCCKKAEGTGYVFSEIESWIFALLDQLMG